MVKVLDANLSAFYDRTVNRFEVFARGTVNLCWATLQIFTIIDGTFVSNLCCSAVIGGIGIVASTIE